MSANACIDNNILLYAGFQYPDDQEKRLVILELLGQSHLGFSTQVMAEYFNLTPHCSRNIHHLPPPPAAASRSVGILPVVFLE